MMRLAAILVAGGVLLVVGCSERPQVARYHQGTYQGKPDTPPYDAAPFNGNKAAFERELATRAQNQNEYKRTN
jgi:hypothetical protein